MDKEHVEKARLEIVEQIRAKPSPLCERVARELDDYTVTFIVSKNGQLNPAGSGTLVALWESKYILTAAHVWEDALKTRDVDVIAVPLKENTGQRVIFNPGDFVPFGLTVPAKWDAWGPDVVLLGVPPRQAEGIAAAGTPFYQLAKKRELKIDRAGPISFAIEISFLMGAPAERGEFTAGKAVPEMQGMNVALPTGPFSPIMARTEFDFIDVVIDTKQPDVAANFQGVSGGGLWRVYLFKDADGQIQSFKILDGVAFWQIPGGQHLSVRCHGPQTIGLLVRHLYR